MASNKTVGGIDKYKIEGVDRYDFFHIANPDPVKMCLGQCEGTGWVPVHKDDMKEPFHTLWLKAEEKEPTDDEYHFVICPDCKGTGLNES